MIKKDARIKLMNEVLNGVKVSNNNYNNLIYGP